MVEMEINQEDGEQATPSSSSLSSSEEVISLQQHQSVPLKTTTQELTKSGGGGCTSFHFDVASRTFLSVWRVSLANGVMKNILHRYCQQTKSFLQANTEYTLRCSQKALVPACFWSVASSDSGNDGVKDGDTEMGESDINDNTNDSNDNDTTDGKSWCFTLENPKELIDFDPSWMSFLIYQEEAASLTSSGPAATRFHGYLETTNIISLFQLQARFGGPIAGSSSSDIDIKFENRLHRGISRQEAIESCRKSPRLGGPYEFDRLAVRGNKNIPNGMKSQDETNVFDHFICNADESTSSVSVFFPF